MVTEMIQSSLHNLSVRKHIETAKVRVSNRFDIFVFWCDNVLEYQSN